MILYVIRIISKWVSSYLTDFSYFSGREIPESCWTQSEQVKNGPFESGCRWFQLIFIDFQFLAHLAFRPCELLSSFVCRPSVNISHFNLLLRNHWTNRNQTLVEWSLDGPLSKLCPVIPTSNQDFRQAKDRKKGGWNFNCPLLL